MLVLTRLKPERMSLMEIVPLEPTAAVSLGRGPGNDILHGAIDGTTSVRLGPCLLYTSDAADE